MNKTVKCNVCNDVGFTVEVEPECCRHYLDYQKCCGGFEPVGVQVQCKCTYIITKDEIISTGDWYLADYINSIEGFYWKHKNVYEDGYVFYMRRNKSNGFSTIIEEGRDDNKLFEGYITSFDELKQIVHFCRLHEI